MALVPRGKKGLYSAVVWVNGKPRWKTTGTSDYRKAKTFEGDLLRDSSPLDEKEGMTWLSFKKKYLDYSKREKKPKTHRDEELTIGKFERILYAADVPLKYITDFTKDALETYKEKLKEMKLKDSTINRYLEVFKAMGQWGEDEEPPIFEINPLRKLKKKTLPKSKGRPYSQEEMKKFMEDGCWDLVDRLQTAFGYYAGKRRGEIARMKRTQVDLGAKVIYPSDKATSIKDEGVVPLHPELEKIILEWYKETPTGEYVIEISGRALRPEYISLNHKRIAKRAEVKGSHHRFRHTFISRLTESDMNMEKIRDMVGHSNISTTQGYSRNKLESVRKDFEKALDR